VKLLLDTCAVLYSELKPEKLGAKVRKALTAPDNEIYISAVTIGEIACLYGKKIKLKKHWRIWMREALGENKWSVLPIDGDIIEEAYSLPEPFHRDPADRILVATSRLKQISLVTNDTLITSYPHVNIFW
jgi:PIN domain nuclease of toxin-antitoxin system